MNHTKRRKQNVATWLVGMALVCCFSVPGAIGESPQASGKQKISEGQYVRMKNNTRVPGSEQDWTLWREPTGELELEDHFTLVNPADQLLAALSGAKLSPELRNKLRAAVNLNQLVARLAADHKPEFVRVGGTKLVDGRAIERVKCELEPNEVRCKGIDQSAKLRRKSTEEFFYAFPFPMLLSGWLTDRAAGSIESSTSKLVCLDAGPNSEDKLRLFPCDRQIALLDDESLIIGDREFHAHKARIQLRERDNVSLDLTVWFGGPGLVYAMEGGGPQGERVALVAYKKYAEF